MRVPHEESGTCPPPLWWWKLTGTHHKPSCFYSLRFYSNGDESPSSSSSYSLAVCSLVRPTLPLSRALAAEYLDSFSLKYLFSYLPTLLEHGLRGESQAFSAKSLLKRLPSRGAKPLLPHLKSSRSIRELRENMQLMRASNAFLKNTTPCAVLVVF